MFRTLLLRLKKWRSICETKVGLDKRVFPALESRCGEDREALEVLWLKVEVTGALARSVDDWRDSLGSTPANTQMPKINSQGSALFSLLRERDQILRGKNGIANLYENS